MGPTFPCPFCQYAVPVGQTRCPACGNGTEIELKAAPHPVKPAAAGNKKLVVVGALGALVVVGVMVVVLLRVSTEPSQESMTMAVTIAPVAPIAPVPEPPPQMITLTINTIPVGAQIYVRGRLVGASPVLLPIPRNDRELLIEARLGDSQQRVTVIPNEDRTLQLTLEPGGSTDEPEGGFSMALGPSEVRGSLSREIVRRSIRRHQNGIRRCAESSVGRVTVRFVIGQNGRVASASTGSSTLNNPGQEQCINRAIQRLAFPQPEGGGVVIVSTSFIFSGEPAPALTRGEIRERLRNNEVAVRRCGQRTQPPATGTVMMSVTIAPSGTVTTAEVVSSTVGNPAVERCISQSLRRLRFSASAQEMTVNYPIVLQPAQD